MMLLKKYKIFLYLALFLINLPIPFLITSRVSYPEGRLLYLNILRIISLLISIFFFVLFLLLISKSVKIRETGKKRAIFFFTAVIFFLLLETIFMFLPQSHAIGYTLAAKIWRSYYWKPINSLGYRDEIDDFHPSHMKNILIIGDSVVAGHGISSYKNRFSDILKARLSGNYQVYNLGMCGSDTQDEYKRLLVFPVKPELVILQYFVNDIDRAAVKGGLKLHGGRFFLPYQGLNKLESLAVRSSYLLNFIYWQFPHPDYKPYFDFLVSAFGDEKTFREHLNDLNKFIEFSKDNSVPLVVVTFPFLRNLHASESFIKKIDNFFMDRGVKVIDVGELMADVPLRKRVVNRIDVHPSILVNKLVADAIYNLLREDKLIQYANK